MSVVLTDLQARLLKWAKDDPDIDALLTILADPIQDTRSALEFLLGTLADDDGAFIIATGSGEQLDFMGELIGVKRPLKQELPENRFFLHALGSTADPDKSTWFYDSTDETGGYLTFINGISSFTEPGAEMEDSEYRKMILQRAQSFRSKATLTNLFNYMIAFGGRVTIDDDTTHAIVYDLDEYDDMDNLFQWYAVNKGMKPGGINVSFERQLRDESPI